MGRARTRRPILAAAAALLLIGLGACDQSGGEPDGATTEPTTAAPTGEQAGLAPGVTIPETRAGQATTWVLDQLAAPDGPTAEEAEAHFDATFLAEVPAAQVSLVLDQLRADGPYVAEDYSGAEDAAQVPLDGPGGRFILHVVTTPEGRMSGLFFEAAQAAPDITSLPDLDEALADLDAETSVLVADGATCEPLHAREADVARPIGSIIKLYVLDAVRQAVVDGGLTWEDTLTLTDDLRSLPSGTLQDEPAGHEVTVREAAELMISISDNTATDLLIDAVGRPNVLSAVERLDHHDADLLTPLVSTRELFQLGFTDTQLRDRWADAGGAQREDMLAALPGGAIEIDPALATDVVWPDGLDWFATAEDLCQAHVGLQGAQDKSSQVTQILAVNPGVDVLDGWDYVGFKGGSAPGEMAGSWYLESQDGARYVVVLQIAATEMAAIPDAGWLAGVVGQTLEVLAEEA